jgi:hypothetical protein
MSKMGRRGGQPPGGIAIYLLSDELPEVADHARAAARRLAGRIGDLGGVITADPGSLSTAADENEFTIPTAADPCAVTTHARQRLNTIIAAYQDFLDKARGRDDVSFALVVDLRAAGNPPPRRHQCRPWPGSEQHDDQPAMAMAADDGRPAGRASLPSRHAGQRPGTGAGSMNLIWVRAAPAERGADLGVYPSPRLDLHTNPRPIASVPSKPRAGACWGSSCRSGSHL